MGNVLVGLGLAEDDIVPVTYETLAKQDSITSAALINFLRSSEIFCTFAKSQGAAILARDMEDGEKLANGINISINNAVLPKLDPPPKYQKIDVFGKGANDVASELIGHLGEGFKGGVLVLVGLSGTGKGTTVDILKKRLPNAMTWSNGNIFRSLTLLAASYCQAQGIEFTKDVLTPANIGSWMCMLHFGEFQGKFDINIKGFGFDVLVSEVANTTLKGPVVGKNIPTVAEVTQGEVVKFASAACKQMGKAGVTVLLEGRQQTVDYIESPHRFELVMSDADLVGMRRAAQRIGARSLELLGAAKDSAAVTAAITLATSQLAGE